MLTRKKLDDLVVLDPELEEHLRKAPFPSLPWDDLHAMRAGTQQGVEQQRQILEENPSMNVEVVTEKVTLLHNHEHTFHVIRPKTSSGGPLIALIHGGGFIMGDTVQMIGPARVLADLYGAVVVSLSYRFAPEHEFPEGAYDCFEGLKWCANEAARLGADLNKGFIVGGTSAGSNLSAVCAQRYVDLKLTPSLTGVWQNLTFLFTQETVPAQYKDLWVAQSQPELKKQYILGSENMGVIENLVKVDYKSPWGSPTQSETAHQGMPPVFLQVAGGDPLRDDSFIYEDLLKKNGVQTKLICYPGMPHAFAAAWPMLKISKQWRFDFAKGFGWLLGRKESDQRIREVVAAHPHIGGD